MTLSNRLGTGSLKTLAIGLMAMGLALAANTHFDMATAHAASSDPSVYIVEKNLAYGQLVYGQVTGADCHYWVQGPVQRYVTVHPPAAQTGSNAATIEWWARLYRTDTRTYVNDWVYGGKYLVPANSAPVWLGSSVNSNWMPNYNYQLRAQVYVRIANQPDRLLEVNQYLASGTNMPGC